MAGTENSETEEEPGGEMANGRDLTNRAMEPMEPMEPMDHELWMIFRDHPIRGCETCFVHGHIDGYMIQHR